jgi:hypothetical protein
VSTATGPEHLDFDIEISEAAGGRYPVAVLGSPAGEARETMVFPYDELALQNRLQAVTIALLSSGDRWRQSDQFQACVSRRRRFRRRWQPLHPRERDAGDPQGDATARPPPDLTSARQHRLHRQVTSVVAVAFLVARLRY